MKIKFLSFIALILLLVFNNVFSAELSINPIKPKQFNEITVSLNSNSDAEKLAYIYCYIEGQKLPLLNELVMNRQIGGSNFICKYVIPEHTVYLMIKTNIEDVKPFFSIIYDNSDKAVKFSKYTESLNYLASLPAVATQLIEYDSAIVSLNQELKLYPDNNIAKIAFACLNYDLQNISINELDSILYKIALNIDIKNEQLISSLSKALSIVNRTDLADSLLKESIRIEPRGYLAEDNYLEKISAKTNSREYLESADIFLKLFPNSERKNEVITKMTQFLIGNKDYDLCESLMADYHFFPPEQALFLAFIYLEKENKPEKAEALFQKIIYALKYIPDSLRSSIQTIEDWKEQVRNSLAEVYRAYGEYNFQTKQKELALNNFISAYNTYKDMPPKIFENLALYYYKYRMDDKAIDIVNKAIINSKATDKVYEIFDKLYDENKTNINKAYYLDSLELLAKNNRINDLRKSKLNKNIKLPVLMDADELMIDMSIFKGKVIVIELFASWCDPCEKSFNSLMQISEKNNDSKIKFFAVDIWEKQKVDLSIYQNTSFKGIKIFVDEKNSLAKSIGIKGLPVRLFFDKSGKLQFAETGTIGNKDDIDKTKDIIELLSKD
jgi:thiol-disulfide isomerase/thioredoxin